MINAVNALLECITTGLFTAGFILWAVQLGWFPAVVIQTLSEAELESMQEEDEDYGE